MKNTAPRCPAPYYKNQGLWCVAVPFLAIGILACCLAFNIPSRHDARATEAAPYDTTCHKGDTNVFMPLPATDTGKHYPFINYDSNRLWIGQDTSLLNRAFAKWIKAACTGQGNFNIMHIGSSHVQGGTLPHRVRTNILRNYSGRVADRGMLFPYSAASNCNNPHDYVVHCPQPMSLCRNVYKNPTKQLGLCGIAVTAMDTTTTIDIALKDEGIDYATNQIVILGYRSDSLHRPAASLRGQPSSPSSGTANELVPLISYQGHNVAPSYIDLASRRYIFNLSHSIDSFRVILPCTRGQMFTLTGVYLGNRGDGFSYHSIGVNGASLDDYNTKCPYLRRDLLLIKPDMVILGIGINDAAGPNFDSAVFHQRYLTLIDSIRSVNRDCAFIFITNNDSYRRVSRRRSAANSNALQVQQVMYDLARETKGAVWDQFEIMGGLRSITKWRDAKLAQRDRVHFTAQGYTLLGDMLSNALFEAVNYYYSRQQERGRNKDAATADGKQQQGGYYLTY